MFKILSINPGSTSTKFAVYEDETLICLHTIRHTKTDLKPFKSLFEQYEFRKNLMLKKLNSDGIDISGLSAVVGRGGLVRPLESGVYEVNEKLISDLKSSQRGEHVSNLGGLIAHEIAEKIPGCKAFIADPVVVDAAYRTECPIHVHDQQRRDYHKGVVKVSVPGFGTITFPGR